MSAPKVAATRRPSPRGGARKLGAARRFRGLGGFTLVEMVIVMAVTAVLTTIALPSFISQVHAARRLEAIADIGRVVQAQERYRAQQPGYGDRFIVAGGALRGVGSSTDSGAADSVDSAGAHYLLSLADVGTSRHAVLATAQGGQAADSACRVLRLSLVGGNLALDAGPSATELHGAGSSAARRCWRQ
nr:type IV pilin protein [Rivibacter subsaxonicus]